MFKAIGLDNRCPLQCLWFIQTVQLVLTENNDAILRARVEPDLIDSIDSIQISVDENTMLVPIYVFPTIAEL